MTFVEIIEAHKWKIIIFLFLLFIAGIVLIVIKTSPNNSKLSIPDIIDTEPISIDGDCTSCQFANSMKDYENIICKPTTDQLKIIENMTPEKIKYCGNNICLPEMEQLLLDCFKMNNGTCTNCKFIDLLDDGCMVNSYSKIDDSLDGYTTNFLSKLYISDYCGCTPTEEQVNLYNKLISNNNNMTICKENGCYPEMDEISTKCLFEKGTECTDCNFFSLLSSDCVKNDYFEFDSVLERKDNFNNSCNCIISDKQLGILDSIKLKDIDYKTCNKPPYCDEVKDYINCIPDEIPEISEIPEIPGFIFPPECGNCEFKTKLEGNCIEVALNKGNNKYYIALSCGCTPTGAQLTAIENTVNNGSDIFECLTNNCNELAFANNC